MAQVALCGKWVLPTNIADDLANKDRGLKDFYYVFSSATFSFSLAVKFGFGHAYFLLWG